MGKIIYVGLAALAVWGAGANAHAASPVVAAEYRLYGSTTHFAGDVTTSPNGVAIFRWNMFDTGVSEGAVAVMKNAGEPFVAHCLITTALNRDWSKIAIGREWQVSDPRDADTVFVDDVEKVAREIGVQPAEVIAALYDDGMVGISLVSQPVIVDLETRVETPLAVAGGDFLYWLNDDELVIGRETSGARAVPYGSMEAIKYDVRNGERETFPSEDLRPLLNERCTVGVKGVNSIYSLSPYARSGYLSPPYTSKDWRLLPTACATDLEEPAPPVGVPVRGGQFQNDEGAIYWVPAASGPTVKVAAGNALAASDDGVWLFVRSEREFSPYYVTIDGVRVRENHVSIEGFYALRLAWK